MDAMTKPTGRTGIEALGDGRFAVTGVLNASTATAVLEHSAGLFRGVPRIEVDLANVVESDSAGLALLIEWLREAKQNRQEICFRNLPAQIAALARISEVEDLLGPHNGDANAKKSAAA
jgi:phospholipid transport system transporter-binding protein